MSIDNGTIGQDDFIASMKMTIFMLAMAMIVLTAVVAMIL